MSHLHQNGVDLVVCAFVVHESKVLLVHHKKMNGWFPVGGHVELIANGGESSDEALYRELEEETGLTRKDVQPVQFSLPSCYRGDIDHREYNTVDLLGPWRVEMHDFSPVPGHRHLALMYLLRSLTDKVKLEADAHNDIRWFTIGELKTEKISSAARCHAIDAILIAGIGL